MKQKIVGLFVCMLMVVLVFQMPGTAFSDDVHEITDDEGDTRFEYVDVVWASFYENADQPQYLYAALQISNLQEKKGCVYAIHWYFNDVHYDTALHNGLMLPPLRFKIWSSDYYDKRTPMKTWNDTLNSGSFDPQNDVIIWTLHKSCIGFPQPGDILTHAYVFTAQRIANLGLIPFGRLFMSFSDSSDSSASLNYIIQY